MSLILSRNSATGLSLNFSSNITCPSICPFCYGQRRSKADAARLCVEHGLAPGLITSNNGPITWPKQQEVYRKQTLALQQMTVEGIAQEARRLTASLRRRHYDNIRVPGCGDLFPQLVDLCLHLAGEGIKVWGFTRKPDQILRMAADLKEWTIARRIYRPTFRLSIDRWTTKDEIKRRADAGMTLAGKSCAVLAYMALPDETAADIRAQWWWPLCAVVLGYHATMKHTKVGIAKECPKTAGRDITCQTCKRCQRSA